MTVRSIIDVEVQAAAFEEYQKLFDAYSEKLRKQPDIWKQIQGEHAKVARGFVSLGNATEKHLERLEKIRDVLESERALGEDQQKLSMATASAWKETAGHSDTFARNLGRAALTASKWGALMFGTAAFGAAFGIDRLASDASGQRQAAMGLGTGIGQLKAFTTNFARVGDINGLLAQTNQMETDISKQVPWRALGLGAMSGNAVTDAMRYLDAIRAFAQHTPLNQLGIRAAAYGINADAETLRRMRATSGSEWSQMERGTRADMARMNVPGARNLQELHTQLARNAATVSAALEKQLARAAPALTALSAAATTASVSLIDLSGNTIATQWKRFEKNPRATLAGWGATALGAITDPWDALMRSGGIQGLQNWAYGQGERLGTAASPWLTLMGGKIANSPAGAAWNTLRNSFFNQKLAGLDTQFGLPAGLLEITRALESGTHFSPAASSKGALGVFQFMPGVAKRMGFNPLDPDQSAVGAARLYSKLDKEFHGNIPEMLAAYNWNPDSVERLVKKYGDTNWSLHIPRRNTETPEYLRRAARMFKPYAVDITIVNKTGSDVIASMSALGSSK